MTAFINHAVVSGWRKDYDIIENKWNTIDLKRQLNNTDSIQCFVYMDEMFKSLINVNMLTNDNQHL